MNNYFKLSESISSVDRLGQEIKRNLAFGENLLESAENQAILNEQCILIEDANEDVKKKGITENLKKWIDAMLQWIKDRFKDLRSIATTIIGRVTSSASAVEKYYTNNKEIIDNYKISEISKDASDNKLTLFQFTSTKLDDDYKEIKGKTENLGVTPMLGSLRVPGKVSSELVNCGKTKEDILLNLVISEVKKFKETTSNWKKDIKDAEVKLKKAEKSLKTWKNAKTKDEEGSKQKESQKKINTDTINSAKRRIAKLNETIANCNKWLINAMRIFKLIVKVSKNS